MFRIEFFVEDRKLAPSLKALAGLARGAPSVTPVINVEEGSEEGGPEEPIKAASNGKLIDLFARHLKHNRPTEIKAAYVQEFLQKIGRSKGSYPYLIGQAVDAGYLKKSGKGTAMRYRVTISTEA